MKKTLTWLMVLALSLHARAAVECSTWAQMSNELGSGHDVVLIADIAQENNGQIGLGPTNGIHEMTLDLNGHKLIGSTSTYHSRRVFAIRAAHLTIDDSSPNGGGMIDGQNVNRETSGGFAYLTSASSSITIKRGTIANFAAAAVGGAICAVNGTLSNEGGTITNCTAASGGGGVYLTGSSAMTMSGGRIVGCSAANGASTIYSDGNSTLTIKGGLFEKNKNSGNVVQCGATGTISGGLFDTTAIGRLASGYATTPVAGTSLYLVGLNVTTNPKGELLSGSMGCDPSARLYNEAGVRLAEGCHVTRSGTGYAIVSVNGIVQQGSVNEAIAFHGFLKKPDGTFLPKDSTVKIDFKLYPSANADAELLWARRIAVTIDEYSGYYVDITDAAGQSYQAAGGVEPTCATLRAALARHAQLSAGPVWIAYEPVSATVTTPFPRVPLHLQPIAQRASSAQRATAAAVGTVAASSFATATNATVTAERVFIDTDLASINGFTVDVPNRDVALNKSGAVKLRGVTGLNCSAATNTLGALARDLPATADSDCGRVVKHSVNGVETQTAIYYSKGDATALPEGSTNVYVWSFGPLVEK